MSTRLYLAGRLAAHDIVASMATFLRGKGYKVTSRWHDKAVDMSQDDMSRPARQAICSASRLDLREADAIVALLHPACQGTLMEIMEAYSTGKRVVCIGDPYSVTLQCDMPGVHFVSTVDDAIRALDGSRGTRVAPDSWSDGL